MKVPQAPEPQKVNDAIISASLVPVAVANTMLFIGTNMKAEDCQFELRIFLIAAGALVLSLSIFSIMAKFLLDEMARGVGARVKSAMLYILSILNGLLRMTEVIIMITGAIIVMAYWSRVVFKRPPGVGDVYCDEVSLTNQSHTKSLTCLFRVRSYSRQFSSAFAFWSC